MPGKATTTARDERLEARVSRDQKAMFQHAAELQGRTLTDFVIASVHDAAVRVIEETQTIRLSATDSRAFAEVLLHPREPNARLKAGGAAIPQADRRLSDLHCAGTAYRAFVGSA